MTATGFQARAGFHNAPVLKRVPGATSMSVAQAGYRGLMAGRRAIVPGLGNKLGALVLPLVPDAILQPIVYRFQRSRA